MVRRERRLLRWLLPVTIGIPLTLDRLLLGPLQSFGFQGQIQQLRVSLNRSLRRTKQGGKMHSLDPHLSP